MDLTLQSSVLSIVEKHAVCQQNHNISNIEDQVADSLNSTTSPPASLALSETSCCHQAEDAVHRPADLVFLHQLDVNGLSWPGPQSCQGPNIGNVEESTSVKADKILQADHVCNKNQVSDVVQNYPYEDLHTRGKGNLAQKVGNWQPTQLHNGNGLCRLELGLGPRSTTTRLGNSTNGSHCSEESKFLCSFKRNRPYEAPVWVSPAPPKLIGRMREKLLEYHEEGAEWPLTACILDPVRASIVCNGPAEMMEVIGWILASAHAESGSGLHVCRIKNKFSLRREQLVSKTLLSTLKINVEALE